MPQRQTQDQAGDDGDFVGLENVRRHAGTIAHVVAHQVGDHRWVPRIIFWDPGLHFAHQVGAHIGRFGVDAAAHPHEERHQRPPETEAQQGIRRGDAEDDEDDRSTEQPQPVGEHAGDRAGPVGDPQGVPEGPARGGGNPHVGLHRHAHADLAHGDAEDRAHHEG